jgi:hypothetical protein
MSCRSRVPRKQKQVLSCSSVECHEKALMLLSLCRSVGGKNHARFDAPGKLGPKRPHIHDVKIAACRADPVGAVAAVLSTACYTWKTRLPSEAFRNFGIDFGRPRPSRREPSSTVVEDGSFFPVVASVGQSTAKGCPSEAQAAHAVRR